MSIGKRVVVGSFLISSGNFIDTLISAVGSIIITRLLTPSEYGLIGIALMYPLMLSGLMDFGLSNALLRYSSIDKQGRYVGVGILIKFVVAVVSGVAVFIFADAMALSLARPYLAFMIKVLSLYTFSYILLDALGQVLLGLDEYGKAMLIGIVRNVLRVSIAVVLILLGLGVYGAVLSFSVAYTSILPLATFFVMRRAGLFTFDRKVFKEILIYSIPLYIPVLLGVPAGQL
ncbi:MAG: oligosaccharide flippase family protein, partial [Candidatus Bathyarchaeia archaeon]